MTFLYTFHFVIFRFVLLSDVTKPVAMPSYRHSAAAPSKPLGSGSNPPAASGLSASTQAAHGLGPFR